MMGDNGIKLPNRLKFDRNNINMKHESYSIAGGTTMY